MRVKELRGKGLIRTFQGYQNYTGSGHNGKGLPPTAPLPWAMVDGQSIASKTFDMSDQGVDTSKKIEFTWDEVIGKKQTGIFFVDVSGQAQKKSAATRTTARHRQSFNSPTSDWLGRSPSRKLSFTHSPVKPASRSKELRSASMGRTPSCFSLPSPTKAES